MTGSPRKISTASTQFLPQEETKRAPKRSRFNRKRRRASVEKLSEGGDCQDRQVISCVLEQESDVTSTSSKRFKVDEEEGFDIIIEIPFEVS